MGCGASMTDFIMNVGLWPGVHRLPEHLKTAADRLRHTLYNAMVLSNGSMKVALRHRAGVEPCVVVTGKSLSLDHMCFELSNRLRQDCVAVWTLEDGLRLVGPKSALWEPVDLTLFFFE